MKKILLIICLSLVFNFFAFTANCEAENPLASSKKVILLIGDGMGAGQLGLLDTAWEYGRKRGLVPDRSNAYAELIRSGNISLINVRPKTYLVADSACAASSISTGKNCLPETLGLDESGNNVEVFSEFAKRKKISVGLVSDTRLTHATPAAFYSHSLSRRDESFIAKQFVSSDIDVAFSAGSDYFGSSQNNFAENLFNNVSGKKEPLKILKEKGYQIVKNKEELINSHSTPVIGLFEPIAMPDAIDSLKTTQTPTLLEMSKKAFELIKNKESYFLMIEAGQIDWAAHQNDPGLLLQEMLRFEGVLNFLNEMVKIDPSITLMVTSDHETGGFGFSYRKILSNDSDDIKNFKGYSPRSHFISESILEKLFSQKISLRNLAIAVHKGEFSTNVSENLLKEKFGIGVSKEFVLALGKVSRGSYKIEEEFLDKHEFYSIESEVDSAFLSKYLSRDLGVVWSTGTHTVPLIPFIVDGKLKEKNFKKPLNLMEVGELLRNLYQ